jgi:hypothetical protein
MDPTKLKTDDISRYNPGEYLSVYEWFCPSCEEQIGHPYIEETNSEICNDATKCPHSVEWGDDPCGYVVCRWCHEPATEIEISWTNPKQVEKLAEAIGVEDEVNSL